MNFRQASRWTAAALSLAFVVASAAPALARGKDGPCRGKGLAKIERRLESLDLAPDQRLAAEAIFAEARSGAEARREEMRAARKQMKELLRQDTPDTEAVMAQADVLGALRTEAGKARLRTMLALREQLTAEQWEQIRPRKKHRGGRES